MADVKTVLIGGAEGHLGSQAVAYFSRKGKKVVASCRTEADLQRVRGFVEAERLAGVTPLLCDLGNEDAVRSLVADAERQVGPLDGLFNAAGGFRWTATTDCSLADFEFLMTANLRTSFLLAKHVVPGMRARNFGRIVLVSSRGTLGLGEANMGIYTASKAAVNALVGGLAAELRKTGVRVNVVMPTVIDTPANRRDMTGADPADWVTTDALLEVVAMLLGPTGEPLNGALIPVAGRL